LLQTSHGHVNVAVLESRVARWCMYFQTKNSNLLKFCRA
jgi:hypothetical protein